MIIDIESDNVNDIYLKLTEELARAGLVKNSDELIEGLILAAVSISSVRKSPPEAFFYLVEIIRETINELTGVEAIQIARNQHDRLN